MITKERLQKLIEQGATIYSIFGGLQRIGLRLGENFIKDNKLYEIDERKVEKNEAQIFIGGLGSLFETEEDARWELEMTATRMETLKLPMWEEIISYYSIKFDDTIFVVDIVKKRIIVNTNEDYYDYIFDKPATKENYIEACKLCLRLFRGEEV